jgi:hypothetical protein
MRDAEVVKQVVAATEPRYFDSGHFVLDELLDVRTGSPR